MRRLFTLVLAMVVIAAVAIAACSDREDPDATPGSTPGATSTPSGPPPTRPPSTPQPLTPALQQIMDNVASVRELEGPPELEVHLIERSSLPGLLDSLLTEEDREWFRNTTTLYRLLGHFRDDQDYESIYKSFGGQSVLGLYSPLDDALWVVHNDGETLDLENLSGGHKETLAHELVHAIQDYHFKLDEVYERTVNDLDWGLVYTSAVEGDAVISQREYSQKFGLHIGAGPVLLASGSLRAFQDVPISIVRELLFPYTTGAAWVREVRDTDGLARVNELISNPPRASAYVLHPELLFNGFQPETVQLPDLIDALGSGWEKQSGGQFGEFQLRNYLQLRIRGGQSAEAATGWAGDHYDVYVNGDESVAAFRVTFGSENDAREFVEAQEEWLDAAGGEPQGASGHTFWETDDGNTTASAGVVGDSVVFVIASSRELAQTAINAVVHG